MDQKGQTKPSASKSQSDSPAGATTKRTKTIPESVAEADKLYKKYLLTVDQVANKPDDVLSQLVYGLVKEVLRVSIKYDFTKIFENSHLVSHYASLGTSLKNDFAHVGKLLKEMELDFNEDNLKHYFNIVNALCELVNMNILNYSVYIDPSKFGKQRIFSIIENLVFSQVMPTEITDKEKTFKLNMRSFINELKAKQKITSKAEVSSNTVEAV